MGIGASGNRGRELTRLQVPQTLSAGPGLWPWHHLSLFTVSGTVSGPGVGPLGVVRLGSAAERLRGWKPPSSAIARLTREHTPSTARSKSGQDP